MKEIGRVKKILKDSIAEVELKNASACAKCGKCSIGINGEMFILARNDIGVQVNDQVLIEIIPKTVVFHSFLIYIMPLVFLFLGYFIGSLFHPIIFKSSSVETIGLLFSVVFFISSFGLLKLIDALASRRQGTGAIILKKEGV